LVSFVKLVAVKSKQGHSVHSCINLITLKMAHPSSCRLIFRMAELMYGGLREFLKHMFNV